MIRTEIKGLQELQKTLADAQRAFKSVDGEITSVNFNPGDPDSVQEAILQMESAVDAKAAPYARNPLVAEVVRAMKERYRERILAGAEAAG